MPNRQLPPNPPACQSLTDPDRERLKRDNPGLWSDPEKTCLTCQKRGAFSVRQDGQVLAFDCDCAAQWKLHRWLLNSGVGLRYQRLSWTHCDSVNKVAVAAVTDYLDYSDRYVSAGRGLTLGSPAMGTGKTMLATLLFKALLADGLDGYMVQFNDMLNLFSAGWRNEEDRKWFIRRVRNAGVLVVDDIGREHKGRAEVSEAMFDEVIRHRDASCKPTIITTNYTEQELLQGYGGNIMSLLSGVNTYVPVPGMDYRPRLIENAAADARDGIAYPIVIG
jgi:DNA replication protein DnaC